jgi:hypothetical protein
MRRDAVSMRAFALCGVLLVVGLLAGCGGKADINPVTPPPSPGPKSRDQDEVRRYPYQVVSGCGSESCEELYPAGQVRFLQRDDFPPSDSRFYDPGRRSQYEELAPQGAVWTGWAEDENGNPVLLKAEFSDIPHKRGIVSWHERTSQIPRGHSFLSSLRRPISSREIHGLWRGDQRHWCRRQDRHYAKK